jgi:hypothetical protein
MAMAGIPKRMRPGAAALAGALLLQAARAAAPAGAAAAPPPGAPAASPPAEETLRQIEERGRQIATYLQALAAGTERLRGQGGDPPGRSVVLQARDGGWEVLFLAESPSAKGPVVIAQVGFDPTSGQAADLRLMAPPRPAPGATVSHARAIETAEAAMAQRSDVPAPREAAVFREKDGTFSVYLMSAAGDPGVPRFGADLLARVAASGRQILSVEPLHAEETVLPPAARAPGQATLHAHGRGDLPAPTDVATVLRHPDLAPHLVLTPRSMFRIDARGGITYLGPNPAPRPAGGDGR